MSEMHPLRTADIIPSESFEKLNEKAVELAKKCEQAEVPSLDHLRMADYNLVYEPSDDTFLMLDALLYDFSNENAQKLNSITNVLEIGCGTGVSTIFMGQLLNEIKSDASLYVTDINKDAIRVAIDTAEKNGINMDLFKAMKCDLATPLLEELKNKVDVLIFNPPYVPTPEDEVGSEGIEASWAGGANGRVVFDRAIPQIASLLSYPNGVGYIITVDDNKPEQIADIMMERYGIQVTPFFRRIARNEYLSVQKFTLTRDISSETIEQH